jgi:hypothetical protein
VQPHQRPHLAGRVPLAGNRLAQRVHELRHLVPKERDENVVLGLEIEIDGARGNPRLPRDVRDAGVVVTLAGEHPHGGFDDLLWLVRITHDW